MTVEAQASPVERPLVVRPDPLDRGRRLVVAAAIAVATLSTVYVFSLIQDGRLAGHHLFVAAKLTWGFVAAYFLSEGHAWARWLAVVSLAVSAVAAAYRFVSSPVEMTAVSAVVSGAFLLTLGAILYILLLSEPARLFFKSKAKPS